MEKPKIRFGKFDNKWKKNKLDKVVDFFDNQRIPIDSGERKAGPYPYYGASGIIDYVDGYIFNGEYVLLAEDGANIILRSSPIAYLSKGKFWLNNHAHIMRMKTGSNEFLIQLLEKQNYEKYNTGTAQPKLNGEVVKNITLHFPSDEEQFAIGSLFRTLDDLIASYKDNLINYQSLKATMLSKMFPKAGKTVPEIRLDGFDAEWEIRKLSEVSEVYDGTHQTPNYTESGVKFLSVENISTLESEKYISEEDFEKDFKVFPEFGDVLMTRIGSIGVPNIVKTNEKIAFYVSLALLKPKKKTNSLFMKSSIESNPFQEELWKKTLHIAFPKKINMNDISQSTIKCPSYEEQQAIGAYFSNLDSLISAHQEKISQLETLKKKFLQDMFI